MGAFLYQPRFVTANFKEDRTLPDTDVKRHVHEGRRAKPWFDPLLIVGSIIQWMASLQALPYLMIPRSKLG